MNSIKEGYLYIANSERYISEAINSAISLKNVDEKAHITLISYKSVVLKIFDEIIVSETSEGDWKDGLLYRAKNIDSSPYEKTFFVDTDTYFCESCRELFELLDYYDICIGQDPAERSIIKVDGEELEGYTPYNCGVILFKKNKINSILFSEWHEYYKKDFNEYQQDQPAFMKALLKSKSRVYVFPNIYNARIPYCISLPPLKVKIIHGRYQNYEKLKRKLNSKLENRVWIPRKRAVVIKRKSLNVLVERIIKLLLSLVFNKKKIYEIVQLLFDKLEIEVEY